MPTPRSIRAFLRKQFPLTCHYFNKPLKEKDVVIDHKQPISRGGTFSLKNVAITSHYANLVKGALTEQEFSALITLVSSWEDKGEDLFRRLYASNNIFRRK